MPEELKLLPCPSCGKKTVFPITFEGVLIQIECRCGCSGPRTLTEDKAITAWNSLPRALTWTMQLPKEPGHYWCRYTGSDKSTWSPAYIPAVDDLHSYSMDKHEQLEWAGPIPTPQDSPHVNP